MSARPTPDHGEPTIPGLPRCPGCRWVYGTNVDCTDCEYKRQGWGQW